MRKGITLIEVIVTIGIVVLITSITLPAIYYFSGDSYWLGTEEVVESLFNLALNYSYNKYAGVYFYTKDDKQYAQIVEIDPNAHSLYWIHKYPGLQPKEIVLISKHGIEPSFISNNQILYPVIDDEIIDTNSFYVLFYRGQLRKHRDVYDDEHSYMSIAINNDIYLINRYTGQFIQ